MQDEYTSLIIIADERERYKNLAVHLSEIVLKMNVNLAVFNLTGSAQKDLKHKQQKNKIMNKYIHLDTTPDITIDYLEQRCHELKEQQDLKFVMIDLEKEQLQLDDYGEFSKKLKDLSYELDIMIYVITKFKRNGDTVISIENVINHEITKFADEVWFNTKKGIYYAKSNSKKRPQGSYEKESN